MGNENTNNEMLNENIEENKSTNNPFACDNGDCECEQSSTEACDVDNAEVLQLKSELEKVNNQYIRLAADFDNYRKRQMQERESLLKYGAEDALKKMIEALDNIDRAKASVEKIDDVNTVKDSYNLVFKQIYDVLGKMGLEVIETQGKEFDPNFHEAVMQTPTSEYPENTIIAELQKGYKLADKVLRASLVNVAVSE